MRATEAELLIVDNDPSILFSLGQILRHSGYLVRTAEDGFNALQEMQVGLPDILISDLNMPRMTGFELLSIVRRRFPSLYVIGMTGAFVDRLPSGIAADAFYRKATNISKLFEMIQNGVEGDRASVMASRPLAPIWVPEVVDEALPSKRVLIGCPECLRAFAQEPDVRGTPRETLCEHCRAPIHYVVVEEFA